MAAKTRRISTLIESQLPGFISSEYENFSKFIEKYYEQLESTGQPLDIISNITKYRDINFYESNLLKQQTTLTESIVSSDTSFTVADASSFPEENGYIKIGDEICFYKSRTDTEFLEVTRGVSGNNTLGDLYSKSEFVTTQAKPHYNGDVVYNISNLFLYAFVKNFEEQYLGAFPEKYLKGEIDKRSLIKNISNFYKAKGTDRSIKFIFNSIISKDATEKVEVYNPKDFTLKSSESDWISNYSLKVKVISGDVTKLVGNTVVQSLDEFDKSITFASAVVDTVIYRGESDGEDIYEIVLEPSTVNGSFKVASKSTLRTALPSSSGSGKRIDIFSTNGFEKEGKILINNEAITYNSKNVNQLVINARSSNPVNHAVGSKVYSFSTVEGKHSEGSVKLITLGILYNLAPKNPAPYSESGDLVQVSDSGFETRDPVVYNAQTSSYRWFLNTLFTKVNSSNTDVNQLVGDLNADVSAIYEDEQYFYICSSSFPSYNSLLSGVEVDNLSDQKHLKLIRKFPTSTTEVYKTSNRDVGILLDGTPLFSYKDEEFISFGKIVSTKIEAKGSSYQNPPYVLINELPGKALANLSGETVGSIRITTDEVFESNPSVRITSGEGARLKAVVTEGRITSITVQNPGQYYSTPPIIRIIDELGKGNFAEYEAILDEDGRISSCKRISGGRFYTRGYVNIIVEPVGKGAQASAEIKKWVKNRYKKLQTSVDVNNGYIFQNFDITRNYGYGVIGNPVVLRRRLNDNITTLYEETSGTKTHSPIIGFAYDGNPIYGPYGYSNPVNSNSSVTRLTSGYVLQSSRPDGPSTAVYPLGTFIDDYKWTPSINTGKTELDQNNGRFCVTPDYPNGVYAYFITINSDNDPVFPYILGENYYSLPVDSNYNSKISQDDLPVGIKRLRTSDVENNGSDFYGYIQDVKSGNVTSAFVESSPSNFSVGNQLIIDDSLTEGFGAAGSISSVNGQGIVSIESTDTKATQISIEQNAYLFAGDTVTQYDSDENVVAFGELIGDVFNSNKFVLRNCTGTFNLTDKINSETKVISLILDKNSTFTKGSILTLTDGLGKENSDIASGEVLEGVTRQNSVKIKVISDLNLDISGDFIVDSKYFLKSSNLGDTNRSKIINITSLSENLSPFEINDNIAIVTTDSDHKLAIGDKVKVDVTPDEQDSKSFYFVRKKLYQNVILNPVNHRSNIIDTGIGSADILNTGADYESGTYQNVELIFQDSSKARKNIGLPGNSGNAKATIVVSNANGIGYGGIGQITITTKGAGYKPGDVLTINDDDLNRIPSSDSVQRLVLVVDHVGFAEQNSILYLSNVNNLSADDFVKVGEEIVKVQSVDVTNKTITVIRGQKNTVPGRHFNSQEVTLFEGNYRFNADFKPFGDGSNKPSIESYDFENKELVVSYDYGVTNPTKILQSSSFFDSSIPSKLVTIKTFNEPKFKLEFSRELNGVYTTNPTIDLQKYYYYVFFTSHFSMLNTYLDFSPSGNYNITTTEKFVSSYPPGTGSGITFDGPNYENWPANHGGSYVEVRFGFGPYLEDGNQVATLSTLPAIAPSPGSSITFIRRNPITQVIIDQQTAEVVFWDSSTKKLIVTFNNQSFKLNTLYKVDPTNIGGGSEISLISAEPSDIKTLTKREVNYSNYFYFVKVSDDVDTEGASLKIVNDPLIGEKELIYTTDRKFVYSLERTPSFDGTGVMSYTTTSRFAVGSIDTIVINNTGDSYKKIPVVQGVVPTEEYECIVNPVYDTLNKSISGFEILNQGKNYISAKAVVVDGDGSDYKFECFVFQGRVTKIDVINPGKNFSYKPTIKIIESSPKIYLESNNIGLPQNIKIIDNGRGFNSDRSTLSTYKSNTTFVLKNFSDYDFYPGETIIQPSTGATARVATDGWRPGSNLLKVDKINGIFENNKQIKGSVGGRTATLVSQLSTEFVPEIKSYYDNVGFYSSDRGKLSTSSQKLTDSYFYQDYSYVIKSKTPIDVWRELIKETTHPAGFQLFGEVLIESEGQTRMPSEQKTIETICSLQLPPINVTTIDTTRYITNSFVSLNVLKRERGLGAVSVDTFDSSETLAYDIRLDQEFNGDFDPSSGQRIGNKSFAIIDTKTNLPVNVGNSYQLFITLDGVFQQPEVAFTVSGSQITFAQSPFGPRIVEGQEVSPQKFYGRLIKFKNQSLNERYFRKIKSINPFIDGVQREFNLYYEDNSIVKTDSNENLLVSLNGVIQNAKVNEKQPFGNSYYILRSDDPSVTDKIVFSEPPIDNEDVYEDGTLPEELKAKELCFIYTIGSYERFTINNELIEYRGGGPYLIVDEIERRVRKIDEPLYAFVFIDGVLQEDKNSYEIVGPNITFTEPLKKYKLESGEVIYQNVSIVLVYGRDIAKTLTFYDFEPNTFYNEIKFTLTGEDIFQKVVNAYDYSSQDNVLLYQNNKLLGKVKSRAKVSDDEVVITTISNNIESITEDNLKFVNLSKTNSIIQNVTLPSTQEYTWDVALNPTDDGFVFNRVGTTQFLENPNITVEFNDILIFNVSTEGVPFHIVTDLSFTDFQIYDYLVYNSGTNGYVFGDPDSTILNPTLYANVGDQINLNVNAPGHPTYISTTSDLTGALLIPNNGTEFNPIIWDTRNYSPGTYYYFCANHPSTMIGQIILSPYNGSYYNSAYDVLDNITNNGTSNSSITWTPIVERAYFYVPETGNYYGTITVTSDSGPTIVPVETEVNQEYLLSGEYTIDYEYTTDEFNNRVLLKDLPSWLFGSALGEQAWNENNRLLGNLLPGDKIKIDGESEYREILNLPIYSNSRDYNEGSIIDNQIYSRVSATNYNGISRGEGLSINAIVNQYGEITSLDVSALVWNQRDLNLYFTEGVLLQPTAYQYDTTPVVYFIPVDGNGGGAKAEVIAYGGQILDVVLLDGGSGYTQPPKVVIARRYERIKEVNRKIDSLTVLNVSPVPIPAVELISSSTVTIGGEGAAGIGIFSLITFGDSFGDFSASRFITTIVVPKPNILTTTQKKFDSEFQVQSPTIIVDYSVEPFVYEQIVSTIESRANIISSSSISFVDREITRRIDKILNNAIIEIPSEAINDIGAFLDAPLGLTDSVVYIPDTRRFPDSSRLLIGKEIVRYARKLPDRFLNVERGTFGTIATTHNAGDYLRHLPELVSIIPAGPATIFTTEVITTVNTQPSAVLQSITSVVTVDSVLEIEKEIDRQHQIKTINTISDVIEEIIIIPPTSYNIVTNIYSTQSYISKASEGAGVAGVASTVDVSVIVVNEEITNIQSINLELDVITSSQITTVLDYAFDSISSVTAISNIENRTTLTNYVNIDVDTSNIVQSSSITLLPANALVAVSIISSIISEESNTEIQLQLQPVIENSIAQSSSQIVSSIDVPFAVYTLSSVVASNLAKNADVERFYKTGSLDFFVESVVLVNPIKTRTGEVTLSNPTNQVTTRSGENIFVANKSVFKEEFYDSYNLGNAGHTLKIFERNAFVDTGLLSPNNSIDQLSLAYPSLTIKDFEERSTSSITLTGEVFNFTTPSIQNPVVYSVGTDLLSSTTVGVVGNTSKFPSSGYLFQGSSTQYTVIRYTGKTSSSFTGCTLVSGSSVIDSGNEIIPYVV